MTTIQPSTAAGAPAIIRQTAHPLQRIEKRVRDSRVRDTPIWSDVIQVLDDTDPPETPGPVWACPMCGSKEILALAWVTLNGEVIEDYGAGTEYCCPRCEWHYKVDLPREPRRGVPPPRAALRAVLRVGECQSHPTKTTKPDAQRIRLFLVGRLPRSYRRAILGARRKEAAQAGVTHRGMGLTHSAAT